MQEAFGSGFQKVLLPAFESSTRAMFQQIHATMQQAVATQPKGAAVSSGGGGGSVSAATMRAEFDAQKAVTAELLMQVSALESSVKAMMKAQEQQMLALSAQVSVNRGAGGGAGGRGTEGKQQQQQQQSVPTRTEIDAALQAQQVDRAFYLALSTGDLGTVLWVCQKLQPSHLFTSTDDRHKLSPQVALSLLQQLGYDLTSQQEMKLMWIRELLVAFEPSPLIAAHAPAIFKEVQGNVQRYMSGPGSQSSEARLVKHMLDSQLRNRFGS